MRRPTAAAAAACGLLLLGATAAVGDALAPPATVLSVGTLLLGESVPLDGVSEQSYLLAGLVPGTAYEVRVSHQSTIPARVTVAVAAATSPTSTTPRPNRRSLLDVTKAALVAPAGGGGIVATVRASPVGAYAGGAAPPPRLPFAITLTPLLWGWLPADAAPAALAAVGAAAVGVAAAPWFAARAAPALAAWVDGGDGAGEGDEDERALSD